MTPEEAHKRQECRLIQGKNPDILRIPGSGIRAFTASRLSKEWN